MDKSTMPAPFSDHHNWYVSTLSSLSAPDGVLPTHLYTYNHVLDGFSAVLSRSQLDELEKMPGHITTYPDTVGTVHTTHTPKFLGLDKRVGLWPQANFGEDMIIGVLDTGIWPESESFRDDDMPPVPERWRGACESGVEFNSSYCNRKLIGARSFSKGMKELGLNISTTDDYDSPRDFYGHGTHTSSTAAGSPVQDASYFNYAKGVATGIAPKARLAMYKVLFFNNSYDSAATDTLAGMDQAIADGVDIMSLSLGFIETPFDENPIAVGAFAAMEKGIFVACSAGNSGPHAYTILNGAPWITTVGAGTIDRDYAADVTLGDGDIAVRGKSIYPEDLSVSGVPIYFGHGNRSKETCDDNSLDPKEVAGKYVFCDYIDETSGVNTFEIDRAGAAGAIFSTDYGPFLEPVDFYIPFVAVTPKDGDLIKDYLIKTKNSTVDIKFQLTVLGTKPAPIVVWFSSRGPARKSPWILKPDILAPGVDILAAWAPNRGFAPVGDGGDYLLTDFALDSGTSMSCPHAAGLAALLKTVHKDWSPAAVRSAMMTTAYVIDNANGSIIDMTTGVAGTPLDYGAGHIDPGKAMDPGLVYDIEAQDYINYLCGLNYTTKQIKVITGRSHYSCDQASLDLNYPSFIVLLNNTNTTSYTFKRVLTNVVNTHTVYHAVVKAPLGMKVVVEPPTIAFTGKYSKARFHVTVKVDIGDAGPTSDYIVNYGYLSWNEVNGTHVVRSPIVAAYAP
ncbi:subtilisin-like protease SBT3 [Actinidia eriantha]|uniref:subtilisin-like protease SBT3 n=1 Tax=Actinidia eriantha TaxID=165200 RepID=UPI00258EC578|nr:subtilisin-like protease SBT3 [Actinidia eriantha]XP_057493813.1 subtilisin-like protease SBT3 [Actinidia eriantha]XP_057493814.1 subtilisin-like protease SBT3 [Actinidia eriantha]XP_057493815.1 subtilisin-like protease SBT3 [Actinidia eriantha]